MASNPIIGNNVNDYTPPSNNSNSTFLPNSKANDPNMFLVSSLSNKNESYMQWKFDIQLRSGKKKKIGYIDGTSKQLEALKELSSMSGSTMIAWSDHDC